MAFNFGSILRIPLIMVSSFLEEPPQTLHTRMYLYMPVYSPDYLQRSILQWVSQSPNHALLWGDTCFQFRVLGGQRERERESQIYIYIYMYIHIYIYIYVHVCVSLGLNLVPWEIPLWEVLIQPAYAFKV